MKTEWLKLIDGASGRILRTRQLPQAEDLDPEAERESRQTKIWGGLLAVSIIGLVAMLALFLIDIGMGGLIALSVVAFFASLWYGQFWLAVLIFLWWLWMS